MKYQQHKKSPPPGVVGFPKLNQGAFIEWKTQTIRFLNNILPIDSVYIINFEKEVKQRSKSSVEVGIGILRLLRKILKIISVIKLRAKEPNCIY